MRRKVIGKPAVAAVDYKTEDAQLKQAKKTIAKLTAENKELRKKLREASKWKAHAARAMKQAEKYRKISEPSGQSIRAVSGGLPSLGKKR